MQWLCERAKETGISYIDSIPIAIGNESQKNKVFAEIATSRAPTAGFLVSNYIW
ncbi:MAG: hypothetical protein ACR5KV_06615 [Wolbachia sp.]